jgi:lipopolysaccharide export LptBFGC system permease protein LptF
MRISPKISIYLLRSVGPYFLFSWVLLSTILFVQQAGRFADIFFSANIPSILVWQLAIALIPNVIAFTCPMAVLVGVIIGLSKMQGDSELVAMRAAGVGNIHIALPIAVLGIFLSIFAFLINLYGVPLAASIVRTVALQTAIYKLESPIEPGVFNTEIAGYTAYVKDGDIETGTWKNIFIHTENPKTGEVRLITSSDGRIDSSGEKSELVLSNAVSSTFSKTDKGEKFVSEKLGAIRFAIQTKRGDLIERLGNRELSVDELGLAELANYAGSKEGPERIEASIVAQRRLLLSVSPLLFCLLGTVLVLRFNRGGRGFGILLALVSLITFYLLGFLGEQLARTGTVPVFAGLLLPVSSVIMAITWFSTGAKLDFFGRAVQGIRELLPAMSVRVGHTERRNILFDLTTGLRDFDLLYDLFKYYVLTLAFLAAVFVIFTAFELWKFAGTTEGGLLLLAKYLFFLLPFIYISLAPSAAMIATLATYVIKSRQNEIVTWLSAGQSIYRLLVPCFVLMCFLGSANWLFQDQLAPVANRYQDQLRNQLRSRGKLTGIDGELWVANDKRIYSFRLGERAGDNTSTSDNDKRLVVDASGAETDTANNIPASDNDKHLAVDGTTVDAGSLETRDNSNRASDNEKRGVSHVCITNCSVHDLTIYEFVDKGERLQTLYRGDRAVWDADSVRFVGDVRVSRLGEGSIANTIVQDGVFVEERNPFNESLKKPSQLSTGELREQIAATESDIERRGFQVALEKRYSTLFLPLIIALFTAPFALSLSRKGKVVTVAYAVGLWLLFMGVTAAFEQFGLSGTLSPLLAIWAPLGIFALLGIFLLSKVRT